MYARLVSSQVNSDKLDRVIQVWKERDTPLMKSVKGYRGAFLFSDRKTGKAISMTFWMVMLSSATSIFFLIMLLTEASE